MRDGEFLMRRRIGHNRNENTDRPEIPVLIHGLSFAFSVRPESNTLVGRSNASYLPFAPMPFTANCSTD